MRRAKKKKVEGAEATDVVEASTTGVDCASTLAPAAEKLPPMAAAAPAVPDALHLQLKAALLEVREDAKALLYFRKEMRRAESARDVVLRVQDAVLTRLEKLDKHKDRAQRPSPYKTMNTLYVQSEKVAAARVACLEATVEHFEMYVGAEKSKVAARDVQIRVLKRDIRRLKKAKACRSSVRVTV